MANGQAITDYTNRDYASLLGSLLDLAALKLPEWTDRSENDLGRLLLELFAYVGDVLLYYQDRVANEAFLATAVERRSVIDLLALIGYTLASPAPASARLTVRAPAGTPVHVEVGARFATVAAPGKPAVEFLYLPPSGLALDLPSDANPGVPAANDPKTVVYADALTPVLNATQVINEQLGTSRGQPNQAFALAQGPVLLPRDPASQDYLSLEVDPGSGFERWLRQGTLLYSLPNDPHFLVQVDENDLATIVLGDGTYGRVPPTGAVLRASYLTGGGAGGNVGAGTITVVKSGVSVPVGVTNAVAAAGGADRESIEHARRLAPDVFRSLGRAVTATDYKALAESVPGVARAIAVAPLWNYVDLYVVATGGLGLTDDLRARLLRYFESRRVVTTLLSVRAPDFVALNVAVEVAVAPTYYQDDVRHRVGQAIAALFQIDAVDFAQVFYLSQVYEAVDAVAGVAATVVTTFARTPADPAAAAGPGPGGATGRIQLRAQEFPRAGTITVTVTGGLT